MSLHFSYSLISRKEKIFLMFPIIDNLTGIHNIPHTTHYHHNMCSLLNHQPRPSFILLWFAVQKVSNPEYGSVTNSLFISPKPKLPKHNRDNASIGLQTTSLICLHQYLFQFFSSISLTKHVLGIYGTGGNLLFYHPKNTI